MNNIKIIGNTPMIKINYEFKNKKNYIYAKLEYYNLTGSIKDRVALYMIKNAKKRGILKEEMPIIEATSGNTGISLAAIGKAYGHKVYIFMPDWVSRERRELIKAYGAEVILYSKEEGGFLRCIEEAKKLALAKDGYLTNQFSNKDNFLAHYETTGKEFIEQLPEELGGFVSGIGTGGTLMGIGKRLKDKFKDMLIVCVEPDKMPLITNFKNNKEDEKEELKEHKIEGIGDEFIPELININELDDVILVNDEDSICMAQKIANKLGIGVGISSGANFLGAILLNEKINEPVATVFADDNKKYLSTDLFKNNEILRESQKLISNNIKLDGYEVI